MRENRLSGSMQGRRETAKGTDNCGQFNPFCPRPPTLLSIRRLEDGHGRHGQHGRIGRGAKSIVWKPGLR